MRQLKETSLFPYFGNKKAVAGLVWDYLGNPTNYVEPFAGSAAVLLGRPNTTTPDQREVINDKDGLLVNFWRAAKHAPESLLEAASEPAFEVDLHARHAWLVTAKPELVERLEGNPDYYDAKAAGWWMWGVCQWIGSGWCSGRGSWTVVDGKLKKQDKPTENGLQRKLLKPDTGGVVNAARKDGLNKISRQLLKPDVGGVVKQARQDGLNMISRQLIRPRASSGMTHAARHGYAAGVLQALQDRLRQVFVACGDWGRVLTPSVDGFHLNSGPIGVFLDPPYSDAADRASNLYAEDCGDVAHEAAKWARQHGDDPRYRIVLAGYEGEHKMPDSWQVVMGKVSNGIGYGNQKKDKAGEQEEYANKGRERLWISPHCCNRGLW